MGTNQRYEPRQFPFAVEQWDAADSHVEEVIALSVNAVVARAAFDEAVKLRPQQRLVCRQGARVIAEYDPPPEGALEA